MTKNIRKYIRNMRILKKRSTTAGITIMIWILCTACNSNHIYTITDFGAVPDGKTLNTKAIQKAIDRAIATKGTVRVPAGTFYTGSLVLGPHMTLQLDENAILLASSDMKDYAQKHLIHAPEADNLIIKGKGTINGNGTSFFDKNWKYTERPQPWIVIESARNVSISGITLTNSPSHCLVFEHCIGVKVEGIQINNHPRSPNTDGIDITNTKNVTISNCRISTGDDAICIKNKSKVPVEENNILKNKITENITVTNCFLESDDAALKLGTGSGNLTRNCTFSDIQITNTRYGMALFMMDGGTYSDITFKDISIETGGRQKDAYPLFMDIHQRTEESPPGEITNISFENIDITTNGLLYISGHPEQNIGRVTMKNMKVRVPFADNTVAENWKKPKGNTKIKQWAGPANYVQAPGTFIVAHTDHVTMNNMHIVHEEGAMERHALYFVDVQKADTLNIRGNALYKETFMYQIAE